MSLFPFSPTSLFFQLSLSLAGCVGEMLGARFRDRCGLDVDWAQALTLAPQLPDVSL